MWVIQQLSRRLRHAGDRSSPCRVHRGVLNRFIHRHHGTPNGGFTLLELMVVVAIIGAIAAVGIPVYLGYVHKARITKATADLRNLDKMVQLYLHDLGTLPPDLDAIGEGGRTDPWGNAYRYLVIATTKKGSKALGAVVPGVGGSGVAGYLDLHGVILTAVVAKKGDTAGKPDKGGGGDTKGDTGGKPDKGGGDTKGDTGPGKDKKDKDDGKTTGKEKPRKDRYLNPINLDYDLYSPGPDGDSKPNLSASASRDDIVRASSGAYIGPANVY